MTAPAKNGWLVYLARCGDNSCYCGITTNIEKRLAQHNGLLAGGAKYTRTRRPISLIGYFFCESKSDALKMEHEIKNWPAGKKLKFFQNPDLR